MKVLPPANFENLKDAFIRVPKLRSRRHVCKVMFLGLVAPPIKGKMDGKILLKRLSVKKKQKKVSYNQQFVDTFAFWTTLETDAADA